MHDGSYYREKLSANRLFSCYEVAPPRIRQYLNAEIQHVASNLYSKNLVLELGCGYGRAMKEISHYVSWIVGNDISKESLELAKPYLEGHNNYTLSLMDASQMAFHSGTFDATFCIQNGISAFEVDKNKLIAESIRVTKDNGVILFSSYSPKVWQDRLGWFRKQSQLGFIGEIDYEKTHNGVIVCKDGFEATTISGRQFIELFDEFNLNASINEVDESSIFCKVNKK